MNESLTAEVRRHARALGFDLVGIADASKPLEADYRRYEAFVDAKMHGSMEYLAHNRSVRLRLDTEAILEGARSVICLAQHYPSQSPKEENRETAGVSRNIARYARGRDYHNHLRKRLRSLADFLRRRIPNAQARAMTDTAPVLERAWARLAGLGFIGKNGLLIVPGVGSYVLLGEVVTTAELQPDAPIEQRCGACRLCLDACPTEAFVAPFVLDARRCIAYLTIEHRGQMPEPLRPGVGEHLFGCDVCQEICPYNRSTHDRGGKVEDEDNPYGPLGVWTRTSLETIAEMDETAYGSLVRSSAVKRAGHEGLVRNAITVLANRGDPRHRSLFERILATDPPPSLREHARWALAQLERADPLRRTTPDVARREEQGESGESER